MIVLIKLLLAHFLGDFVLQPTSWVRDKEFKKIKSPKLYLHVLIHGFLAFILLWDTYYWILVLQLVVIHYKIDLAKLYFQQPANNTKWFFIDQFAHVLSIVGLWILWEKSTFSMSNFELSDSWWVYLTALIFLTFVSGLVIQILLEKWSPALGLDNDSSLQNAGKYIGILERLFVFTFVVTNNWGAIGFLIAAKSVFRFGDLKESKDRKLTEYILIGTLLSFGIAIAIGILVLHLTNITH